MSDCGNRRVLIVVSSYAPTMIADMHRARMLAWELPKLGWEVEILAPNETFQHPDCRDTDSGSFFCPNTKVHYVKPAYGWFFKSLKMRSIGWRAMCPLQAQGLKLLRSTTHFDLVYISTTQFCLFLLGTYWKRRTGIPYVLDVHDPFYKDHGGKIVTTRHRFKFAISNWLSKFMEASSVTAADGLVAVSSNYIDMLKKRYGNRNPRWLPIDRNKVIEFATMPNDFSEAANSSLLNREEDEIRINYVGAGGGIMFRSFALICRALALIRENGNPIVERVKLRLYGTIYNWKVGDGYPLADLARTHGVADLVEEHPERVSYRKSLELLTGGHGAILLGVDDHGYTPSKMYSYALSGLPLLASLHRKSPAFKTIQGSTDLGHSLWFDDDCELELDQAARTVATFLDEAAQKKRFDRSQALKPFLASTMAEKHVALFESCLRPRG